MFQPHWLCPALQKPVLVRPCVLSVDTVVRHSGPLTAVHIGQWDTQCIDIPQLLALTKALFIISFLWSIK